MEEISTNKINKCPYCKNIPILEEESLTIKCNCGLSFKGDDLDQLIWNWNYLTNVNQAIKFAIHVKENDLEECNKNSIHHFSYWVDKFLKFKMLEDGNIK
jgi:hypothetical protein